MEVGKSPDAAGGQLTPSPANLQNPDVRCRHSDVKLKLCCLAFGLGLLLYTLKPSSIYTCVECSTKHRY